MGSRNRQADKDLSFDDFMSHMGVTPIEKRSSPKERGRPTKKQRQTAQRRAAETAFQSPAPAPRPTANALVGRVEELEQQLASARSSLAAEQDARRRLTEQLSEVERARDHAIGQSETLQLELEQQQLQLEHLRRRLRGDAMASPQLEEVLEQRGLKGPDEATFLIRGLLETRQLRGLLEHLQTEDPTSLRTWLEDRVALLCEKHMPMVPSGRTPLSVTPNRCEVCGGSELKRAIRAFMDATLINGLTRISIVGGSAKHHRMLRELVSHRALHLQFAPNLASRTASQARSDLNNSDLVIVWTRGELPEHVARYSGGTARLVVTEQGSIAQMLADAAERLQR